MPSLSGTPGAPKGRRDQSTISGCKRLPASANGRTCRLSLRCRGGLARDPYNPAMNAAKRRAIFERLRAANPHPRSELEYRSPFELLVAVVLSAQATDKGVNKATARLFPVANTPAAFVKLGVDGLIPYISSIGLFNTKAKNVVALSQRLVDEHAGKVPHDRVALEKLPGVGRKTANVVLNVAFGEPDDCRRHAHLSCRESHAACRRQGPGGRRTPAHEVHAGGVPAQRPSLADSARPLRRASPACRNVRNASSPIFANTRRRRRHCRASVPPKCRSSPRRSAHCRANLRDG